MKLFFSVGEPSSDQHCGRLIGSLYERYPAFQIRGFGGPEMAAAGCSLDHDMTEMAVMGLAEVVPKLRQFFRLADQAEAEFAAGNVDAVILADFPGFNWHIAKRAKRYQLPVYYYLPPQLWAWAPWRIKKMRRSVDKVLSVLPFEHQWYQARGIDATYVGHPFFDAVAQQRLDSHTMAEFTTRVGSGQRLVAVLPGSRHHEVKRNWPVMLAAIRDLAMQFPDIRFLVANHRDRHCLWCRGQLNNADQSLPIDFYAGKTSEIIQASYCAMMVSGSVSLELMARQTPAVVIYRVGVGTYTAGRCMVNVPSMTLPNLIANETIFPELASCGPSGRTVRFLQHHICELLADETLYKQRKQQLRELSQQYAQAGATAKAADTLLGAWSLDPRCSQAA